MDYEVILSPKAIKDLESMVRFISLDSPQAAAKLGHNLIEKVKRLEKHPMLGSPVPEFDDKDIRQLLLKPYRIVYRIDEKQKRISVARFWHASRDDLKL